MFLVYANDTDSTMRQESFTENRPFRGKKEKKIDHSLRLPFSKQKGEGLVARITSSLPKSIYKKRVA